MSFLMTAAAFCAMAMNIARNYKTSYMLGPWGWPANDTMITRATTSGSNAQTNKNWLSYANKIKDKGFLFDCVGLIKGILWNWCGDMSKPYGGAGYARNGVPDCGADAMIAKCSDVSTDLIVRRPRRGGAAGRAAAQAGAARAHGRQGSAGGAQRAVYAGRAGQTADRMKASQNELFWLASFLLQVV